MKQFGSYFTMGFGIVMTKSLKTMRKRKNRNGRENVKRVERKNIIINENDHAEEVAAAAGSACAAGGEVSNKKSCSCFR